MSNDNSPFDHPVSSTEDDDFDFTSLMNPQDVATLVAAGVDPSKHTALMLEVVQGGVQISEPLVEGIPDANIVPGSRILMIQAVIPPRLFEERTVLMAPSLGAQAPHPLDGCITFIDQARVLVPIDRITERAKRSIAAQYRQMAAMMQRIAGTEGD